MVKKSACNNPNSGYFPTIDHIRPLSDCGSDSLDNIVICHPISSRAGTNIEKKKIYEKVVHAFYLLEKLANTKLYFVFKGGTSLMLLLKEFNRFSVDIDTLIKEEMQDKIDEVIFSFKVANLA